MAQAPAKFRIFAVSIYRLLMKTLKAPDTYVIIFSVIAICAMSTWFISGANPQTWQIFSALYEGFSQQAGIIAFVLIIGGAFWVVNSTKAIDEGIISFISKVHSLERYSAVRKIGAGNIVIVLVMLLFGIFGAVFGMSEETIAFVAVAIPLAKSLGYDEIVGVCMVYVAAHVGFAGAMLNPFTIGIAQDMSDLPLFSGIEYRTFCWAVLMMIAVSFVLIYASRVRRRTVSCQIQMADASESEHGFEPLPKRNAWICLAMLTVASVLFCFFYSSECHIKIGQSVYDAPWLMWVIETLFILLSIISLRNSVRLYILNLLMFAIIYMVTGVMGYGWYLPEICALFMALGLASGFSAGYSADHISKEFIAGAKDIFSAALVIGFAAGIIVILKNGQVIDVMLESMASALDGAGRAGALGSMYGIQTFINIFIPSASAKAAVTMPIMAPFSDIIGVSRQACVLAFQFGDGFTNMITPCSGVLMAVLSVARIPYEKWFRWVWKFILILMIAGFLLLLPTLWIDLPGF